MARSTALVLVAALVAVLTVSSIAQSADFAKINCLIQLERDGSRITIDNSTKTCSECVWQFLTQTEGLPEDVFVYYDGVQQSVPSLLYTDCGDNFYTNATLSPGLCLLFDKEGYLIGTRQQSCVDCTSECQGWSACNDITWNYRDIVKTANMTALCDAPVAP